MIIEMRSKCRIRVIYKVLLLVIYNGNWPLLVNKLHAWCASIILGTIYNDDVLIDVYPVALILYSWLGLS